VTTVRFDHLVHWVPNLENAIARYRDLGFRMEYGGRNPDLGATNAAWKTGSAYIEVIAIEGEPNAAIRSGSQWHVLSSVLDAGGGALAFAILVDDVAATTAHVQTRGFATIPVTPGRLRLPDGSTGVWTAAVLQDGPAWAPFFINYGFTVDEWTQRDQAASDAPWSIDHVVIETPDEHAAATWLARLLGVSVVLDHGSARVPLHGCDIQFVPGTADRVTTVALAGQGAPHGTVAGLRFVRAIEPP